MRFGARSIPTGTYNSAKHRWRDINGILFSLWKMKFHSVWFLRRIRWNVSSWRDARPDISGRTPRCGRTGSNAAGSLERIYWCQWSRPWRRDGLLLRPWISCRRYERCAPARSRRSEWKPPEFPRILSSTCLSFFTARCIDPVRVSRDPPSPVIS